MKLLYYYGPIFNLGIVAGIPLTSEYIISKKNNVIKIENNDAGFKNVWGDDV